MPSHLLKDRHSVRRHTQEEKEVSMKTECSDVGTSQRVPSHEMLDEAEKDNPLEIYEEARPQ